MLDRDIIERVERDFGPEAPRVVEMLLDARISGRLARCVLVAAAGRLDALQEWTRIGKADARDAIVAGEYDSAHRRVRDLTVPFDVGAKENFWIIPVVRMMGERGYVLSDLQSCPATMGPFIPGTDVGEGVAKFDGQSDASR